ncbi:PREDICTED: uncharacterized protein LOC104824602 [Tarenaya hassleriana]|uniref:uncharacterized protein LOC104824602 n=1 Tax=Tarenaya hassleriana TaxID=28532 RepID=UPI00053C6258|nr:PREDICTED: uncharacterized protein LOC104824602 [Tarenaya hassleriana]
MSWIQINFYMGGFMEEANSKSYYLGGLVERGVWFDSDTLCWFTFEEFVKSRKIGSPIREMWYKLAREPLENKRRVRKEIVDSEICEMCEMAKKDGSLDVFIDHQETEPDVEPRPRLTWENSAAEGDHDDSDDDSDDEDFVEDCEINDSLSDECWYSDNDIGEFDDFDFDGDDFVEEVPCGPVGDDDRDEWYLVCRDSSSDEYIDSDGNVPPTPENTDEEWENFDNPPRRQASTFPPNDFLYLGRTFNSGDEFKKALFDYVLDKKFNVKLSRWDKTKLEAICCNVGCPWRVYCSVETPISKWMIKIYKDDHNHEKDTYASMLTMRQIARLYADRIRTELAFTAEKMQIDIQRSYGLTVTLTKCFKARRIALKMVMEDPQIQFKKLWDYELELNRSNPNTTTEIGLAKVLKRQGVFDRFYVSFGVLRESWKAHCRPIIGLDGCFLKWEMKGELLAAVGRDGNDGMFPIAWAVVRIEDTDTWTWFVKKLRLDLGLDDGRGLTIMSDKQKGLVNAVENELPHAEHRMCTRHIFANFKKKFKDLELKLLFWKAAKCYLVREFEGYALDIRRYNPLAYEAFMRANPRRWCRAFFNPESRCNAVQNNLSESFNGSIRNARLRPIIDMLEEIRRKAMQRNARRACQAERCKTEFTPRFMRKLDTMLARARHCHIIRSGQGKYEVSEFGVSYTVDLSANTCACRRWQLMGIPCQHAIIVIKVTRDKLSRYVSHYFLKSTWQATYQNNINPVNGEPLWQRSDKPPILVPDDRKMPGRPSKHSRRKDPHESPTKTGHMTRHGRLFRCSRCKQTGHNAKTCKNEPINMQGQSSTAASNSSNAASKRKQASISDNNTMSNAQTHANSAQDRKMTKMFNAMDLRGHADRIGQI